VLSNIIVIVIINELIKVA